MTKHLRSLFSLTLLAATLALGKGSPTTLILVRHAEKDTIKNDPPLTAMGWQRAQTLASMLRDAGISAIYATQYIRTQQTVKPIAESLKVPVTILNVTFASSQQHAKELCSKVLSEHQGGVVLVVSHSNVIPLIIKTLGVQQDVSIADDEYDNLFIITKESNGEATLMRLRFP